MKFFYGESSIKDLSKNICLNGEGVGKIAINDDSYSFDYQSALKKDKWLLGIQFPFRGEELLEANFGEGGYYLSGDFVDNAKKKILKNAPYEMDNFQTFSRELAYFIEEMKNIKKDPKFFEKCEKMGSKYKCKYFFKNRVKKVTIWHQEGDHVVYERKLSITSKLIGAFKYPSKQGFKQIDIKLKEVVQNRHSLTYSLQLSNKNCM